MITAHQLITITSVCAKHCRCSLCRVIAESLIVSGGGFSVYAPQPAWQSTAVAAYIASGATLPPPGAYNASGRAYPDVSGIAHNVLIYDTGFVMAVDGTSCSTPIVAGEFTTGCSRGSFTAFAACSVTCIITNVSIMERCTQVSSHWRTLNEWRLER